MILKTLRKLLLPLLFILVILSAAACSRSKPAESTSANTPSDPIEVKTGKVVERNVARYVEVVGSLKADEEVVVSSEVKGIIEELPVDLGSPVKRGQIIARISQKEYQWRVDQSYAALQQVKARLGLRGDEVQAKAEQNPEVRQVKASLDEAKLRFDRANTLIKNGDIAQEQYDVAEMGFRSAEARYQAALDNFQNQVALVDQRVAELQLARKQLNDATILSPLDGIVSQRHVTRGEYIKAETQLVTIVKSNPLRLQAVIPEVAVSSIQLNLPVSLKVDAYPDRSFNGLIRRISPALDEKARTLTVEAVVENNSGELKPGLFAKVRLLVDKQSPAVMVPSSSLTTFAGLTKLFVIQDSRAVERIVKTGLQDGDYIEILEGAKVGERIAIDRVSRLSNGMAVKGKES
ncbi:MAG: efflux RND transporter periplasmic adaptor subunit [Terriglobia bacterium]